MNTRTLLSIVLALGAGIGLARAPWPSAAEAQAGLDRFATDMGGGLRAVQFETGALASQAAAAARNAGLPSGLTDKLGTWTGSAGAPWAAGLAGLAGLALALVAVRLVMARRRRRLARPTPRRRSGGRTQSARRLDRARALAARGRPAVEVARESALSRDAVDLLLKTAPRPDAISGTGRTFRQKAVSGLRPRVLAFGRK